MTMLNPRWALILTLGCQSQSPSVSGPGTDATATAITWEAEGAMPPKVLPGATIHLAAHLKGGGGQSLAQRTVEIAVLPGSGQVTKATAQTDAQGRIAVDWMPGPVPIAQGVRLHTAGVTDLTIATPVEVPGPAEPTPFGKVAAYIADHQLSGPTEDVAFAPDGQGAVMGIPGHLLLVDVAGDVTELATTGDALSQPLGMAYDSDGNLWFCDSKAHALRKMAADRSVTTLVTAVDGEALIQPNDLAVGKDGRVWFTDPCLGKLFRYDPKTKTAERLATFDLKSQGGPNGIALSPDGMDVAVTTENVTLTCGKGGAAMGDPLGALWIAPNLMGPLKFSPLGKELGIFGDGCTYDALGNLYATFDQFELQPSIGLKASVVLVWPKGQAQPQPFLSTKKGLFANAVFGRGGFGEDQLYVALLTVPPFTPATALGLLRIAVGSGLAP